MERHTSAHAYSVTVVASRPVEQQVVPRMEAIKGVLSDILSTQTATGTAINQNSEKAGKCHCPERTGDTSADDFQ